MSEDSPNKLSDHCYCPICRDIFIKPKIYECGHTVCESCMIKMDTVEIEKTISTFDAPIYKCPLCRKKTLISWENRPINHTLVSILENNEEYLEAIKDKDLFDYSDNIEYYKDLNFSHLSFKNKYIKTEEYYSILIPILYKAAKDGKSKVTITNNTKELQGICSMLVKKLFKHGVYKVQATPREFNIYLLPDNSNYRNEYINSEFETTNEFLENVNYDIEEQYNNFINESLSSISNLTRRILSRSNQ